MKTIYTWGYSGSTPEDLAQFVEKTGALLVDARMSPFSRVPHWSGQAIERLVGEKNYLQCKALGNVNYRSNGPIVLANPLLAADYLWDVAKKRDIILMCGCKEVRTCHRKVAAEYLELAWSKRTRDKPVVVHLPSRFSEWAETA